MASIIIMGYLSALSVAAALSLWIPRSETCESRFDDKYLITYALAPGWYPVCKLTHLEFKCPDAWQPSPICEEK
jgi:hypothetical protein